jgi:hypothetical protein
MEFNVYHCLHFLRSRLVMIHIKNIKGCDILETTDSIRNSNLKIEAPTLRNNYADRLIKRIKVYQTKQRRPELKTNFVSHNLTVNADFKT